MSGFAGGVEPMFALTASEYGLICTHCELSESVYQTYKFIVALFSHKSPSLGFEGTVADRLTLELNPDTNLLSVLSQTSTLLSDGVVVVMSTSFKSPTLAAAILASARASVKYKLVEPSTSSSVSNALPTATLPPIPLWLAQ